MNRVVLQPDGGMLTEAGVPVEDPLGALGHGVALAPGFRLRSLFLLLEGHAVLVRLSAFLPALAARVRQAAPGAGDGTGLEQLEVGKRVELIGFPGPPRVEIYTTLQGVQDDARRDLRPFQLEQLLDLPLVLGPLKHVVFGDRMEILSFATVFTLFELIDGVTWELSFHGTPAQCALRR
jgi:hypothetical protein